MDYHDSAGEKNSEPLRIEHSDDPLTVTESFEEPLSQGWYRIGARYGREGVVDCVVELHFDNGHSELRRLPIAGRNDLQCVIRLPHGLVRVAFHLTGSQPPDQCGTFVVRSARVSERISALLRAAARAAWLDPASMPLRIMRFALRVRRDEVVVVRDAPVGTLQSGAYDRWRAVLDEDPERDRNVHMQRLALLGHAPRISVVAILDSPGAAAAFASMLDHQIYPEWQLVLATDAPRDAEAALGAEAGRDRRIFVVGSDTAGEGSLLDVGFKAATGEFVVPLHAGVQLRSHALLEFALALGRVPNARLVYGDDDDSTPTGRANPRFKPAWSPEVIVTHDYIGDPIMVQAAALRQVGSSLSTVAKNPWYELKLRLAEVIGTDDIVHVAKILSHRTPDEGSSTSRNTNARTIEEHLARRAIRASVIDDARSPYPRVQYAVPEPAPLVSILMPTKDKPALLRQAVNSLFKLTRYARLELIVMDNGSRDPETLQLFRSWEGDPRIRVIAMPGPFNYSALNNEAAKCARGEILVLLNNDVEIIDSGWLDEMVGLACRGEIGCVGAKLYYPDGTIQHAGVATGVGGGAVHAHKHARRDATGYLDRLATVTNVSAVTAACLAVRASVYREVGGLDQSNFAIAFNDVDFCMRVSAAGYRNVWTPFAELIHYESVSRGKDVNSDAARRSARELSALQARWSLRLLRDPYYSPHLTMDGEDYGLRIR